MCAKSEPVYITTSVPNNKTETPSLSLTVDSSNLCSLTQTDINFPVRENTMPH